MARVFAVALCHPRRDDLLQSAPKDVVNLFTTVSNAHSQWRIQRGQIRPWPPHRSWQRSLAPLGGRKSNDSIVNLWKCKDFGPRIDVGYGFGPPTEKYDVKT